MGDDVESALYTAFANDACTGLAVERIGDGDATGCGALYGGRWAGDDEGVCGCEGDVVEGGDEGRGERRLCLGAGPISARRRLGLCVHGGRETAQTTNTNFTRATHVTATYRENQIKKTAMSLLFKHLRVHQVFGANTDVGKTLITTALVRASARTTNVFYLKPVSTGSMADADDKSVSPHPFSFVTNHPPDMFRNMLRHAEYKQSASIATVSLSARIWPQK